LKKNINFAIINLKKQNFMKKLFPIMAIAVVGILFTSCKKDYTCTCTETDNSSTPATTATVTFSLGKQTKSKATDMCNAEQTTVTGGGLSMSVTCHL
jgi:branched-subunit amino acid transport protein AzlD